ncbi:Integrase catalytic domain-containing protein [Aphis craccivora]|uniref:Integrase catalytic domain-containing protein n=1 Tax=Aphis craccivora TaxID=307492 RepID=A0A6G0Z7B0_APHCR|nr:Integrase catalytic domain-containing protein [Aphis craccivora]
MESINMSFGPRVKAALILLDCNFGYHSIITPGIKYYHVVLCVCVCVCVRLNAKPVHQLMADLRASRVQRCRSFVRIGADFDGPLDSESPALLKYIYIRVRSFHQVVSDLSTNAFLTAFDRFVAWRGLPTYVYTDCGTNFIRGANKQLHALINSADGKMALANARTDCERHFNPPNAPHFGGLWEAAVRSTKMLLTRVIGVHLFTYEEFTTVLTANNTCRGRVELSTINSRIYYRTPTT